MSKKTISDKSENVRDTILVEKKNNLEGQLSKCAEESKPKEKISKRYLHLLRSAQGLMLKNIQKPIAGFRLQTLFTIKHGL